MKRIEAHMIGGPFHGSMILLDKPLDEYRCAQAPQEPYNRANDPWELSLKMGLYKRSGILRYDPINFRLDLSEPYRFVYEWVGWQA